jgi:hypothetical protein
MLVFASLCFQMPKMFGDADTGWHLAAGEWARTHEAITIKDPFSYTAEKYPWLNISWSWDIAASWLYEQGDWLGLGIFQALLVSTLICGLMLYARTLNAKFVITLFLLLLAFPLIYSTLNVRPHVTCWPLILLTGWMFHGMAMGKLSHRSFVLWTIPLMALWANMHGSFLIWLTFAGAYGVQALINRQWMQVRTLIIAGLVAVMSVCIHPLGIDVFDACWRTVGGEMTAYINEWQAANFAAGHRSRMLYPMLVLILLAPTWRHLFIAQRILLLGWLGLALSSQRHLPVLVLVSLPFFAAAISHWLEQADRLWARIINRKNAEYEHDLNLPLVRRSMFTIACIACVTLIGFMQQGMLHPASLAPRYPHKAIAALKPYYCLPTWNHYNLGGWIIHATQGEWKVFYDGRAETAYPKSVLRDGIKMNKMLPAMTSIMDQYDISLVVYPKEASHWTTYFSALPEWRQVYKDKLVTAYVRSDVGDRPCVIEDRL